MVFLFLHIILKEIKSVSKEIINSWQNHTDFYILSTAKEKIENTVVLIELKGKFTSQI